MMRRATTFNGHAAGSSRQARQDLHGALLQAIKQKTLAADCAEARLRRVRESLSVEEQAYLRSAGGTGAGAFLDGLVTKETMTEDDIWRTAVRHRLGMKHAAYDTPPTHAGEYHHRTTVPPGAEVRPRFDQAWPIWAKSWPMLENTQSWPMLANLDPTSTQLLNFG